MISFRCELCGKEVKDAFFNSNIQKMTCHKCSEALPFWQKSSRSIEADKKFIYEFLPALITLIVFLVIIFRK